MRVVLLALVAFAVLSSAAQATTSDELRAVLERRLSGDRTGTCIAAAVIEQTVATAYVCADPKTARPFDERTAFEIGSVTKTMTAALLAQLILKGEITLDDPLAKLLPPGATAPTFAGEPILLKHVVTHTSGLPALPGRIAPTDMRNPYATLTEKQLLDSLAEAKLASRPGTKFAYSNFAMMVLSYALAKRAGKDFESLLAERLLAPLQMKDSYVSRKPEGVRLAPGHMSNGLATLNWDFPNDMAGVGGVRATLGDMVRYAQAQLRPPKNELGRAIALTQQEVIEVPGARVAMNWFLAPGEGPASLSHGGGTGGYGALVIVDRRTNRGVVLLSDTALNEAGALEAIGLHLIDPKRPLGEPRRVATPQPALLDALAGRYRLSSGLGMVLRRKDDALTIQADGQPEFAMGYDSAGDFYALLFDALLRPVRRNDGSYTFTWHQLGGVSNAERLDAPAKAVSTFRPSIAELKAYEGEYPLAPGFALKVFAKGDRLFVQGTGQQAIEMSPIAKDVFVSEAVGAEITFERDGSGAVVALTLKQNGQVLRGVKR